MTPDAAILDSASLLKYAKVFATRYYLYVEGIPPSEILATVEFIAEGGDDSIPRKWLIDESYYDDDPDEYDTVEAFLEDGEDSTDSVSASAVLATITEHAHILVEFFAIVTHQISKGCINELSK